MGALELAYDAIEEHVEDMLEYLEYDEFEDYVGDSAVTGDDTATDGTKPRSIFDDVDS